MSVITQDKKIVLAVTFILFLYAIIINL